MKKTIKRRKGYFSISAVAEMFSVHQQTIRLYEKEGLISPKRTEGNTRMFAESDIEQLEEVIHLTHELGINLAGVQMILKLQKQLKKIQKEMNSALDAAQQSLAQEAVTSKAVIAKNASELLQRRQRASAEPLALPEPAASEKDEEAVEIETWKVDYDE